MPSAGLPIEQVLGEYSLSFLRRDVALFVSTPGAGPQPSSRRVTTPPRDRRPRPAPPVAATPTLADPPARTVPLPSDHGHAEPMGTPLLRLTPPPGETPATLTRSDALGNAAELRFANSVSRYSHADWKRQQHAEPTCHATIRYISIGRPNFLSVLPSTPHVKLKVGDTECPLQVCQLSRSSESTHFCSFVEM